MSRLREENYNSWHIAGSHSGDISLPESLTCVCLFCCLLTLLFHAPFSPCLTCLTPSFPIIAPFALLTLICHFICLLSLCLSHSTLFLVEQEAAEYSWAPLLPLFKLSIFSPPRSMRKWTKSLRPALCTKWRAKCSDRKYVLKMVSPKACLFAFLSVLANAVLFFYLQADENAMHRTGFSKSETVNSSETHSQQTN